jgi:hypothetical protein
MAGVRIILSREIRVGRLPSVDRRALGAGSWRVR